MHSCDYCTVPAVPSSGSLVPLWRATDVSLATPDSREASNRHRQVLAGTIHNSIAPAELSFTENMSKAPQLGNTEVYPLLQNILICHRCGTVTQMSASPNQLVILAKQLHTGSSITI